VLLSAFLIALGALSTAIVLVLWARDRQTLVGEVARLEAERNGAARAVDEQRLALATTQGQLREAFAALSRSALEENRGDFVRHAKLLLDPMQATLVRVQTQLAEVDKARQGSFQAVSTQLDLLDRAQGQLRAATEGLSRSLGSPNVRGMWGEIQLRRIVELAGMLDQCDFMEKEAAISENGGRQVPDLIIKLPGHATIVVDAKVPIDAYRLAANADTPASREQHLATHTRQVREHIRALGAKEYWKQFQPSPNFVVMFLPLDPLFQAAFERDGSLFDLAAKHRVIPATPMTLLGLLKAVDAGWKQEQLAKNAEEIQQLGRELYERLSTMTEHLEGVGRNLRQAGDSYDKLIGSLEQKVLPAARRFKDLGVASTKDLELVEPLRLVVRSVAKPELIARVTAEEEIG
jgi:DNA recombination protein RmuC